MKTQLTLITKQASQLVLIWGLFLLTACGTFEVGLEPEAEPPAVQIEVTRPTEPTLVVDATPEATPTAGESESPTQVPEPVRATPTASPVAQATPTPTLEAERLQVAYVKEDNVWLWNEETGPTALTKNGGVESVLLSDDGSRIAFRRGGNIWVVNSDGTDERQLTTEVNFEGLSIGEDWDPYVIGFAPYQVAWRPGTHTLFFNTLPQHEGPGLLLSDDLWSLDADAGGPVLLLPPSEGGHFTFSPDGQFIALTTDSSISLVDGNGQNKREVFTYSPIITYSEFRYYAKPVWAADASTLSVAIPPVDPLAAAGQLTAIWSIPTDGRSARLIGNIVAASRAPEQFLFSPDLSRVAYLVGESTDAPPVFQIAVSEIGEAEVGDPVIVADRAELIDSWSPDSTHFIFTPVYSGQVPQRIIASTDGETLVVGEEDLTVFQVTWVDETRYLYLQHEGRGWTLYLAQLGEDDIVAIDGIVGAPTTFDFDG
jgi:hypothetical protein